MIQMLTCAENTELKQFRNLDYALWKYSAWNNCDLYTTEKLEQWLEMVKESELVDVLVCDVTRKGSIEALVSARKSHAESIIVPIADQTVMPSEYVRPDIMPSMLLWKPMDDAQLQGNILRLLEQISGESAGKSEAAFELVTKQETRYIPYGEIFYFEARDKKVFLRLKNQEICFYTTLSKLEQSLPDTFTRCHKSFIINTQHIKKIDWTDQLIWLSDKVGVPLSRSYRKCFKEEVLNAGNL